MRKGPDSNNDQEGTYPVVISNTNILKLLTRSWRFVEIPQKPIVVQ